MMEILPIIGNILLYVMGAIVLCIVAVFVWFMEQAKTGRERTFLTGWPGSRKWPWSPHK